MRVVRAYRQEQAEIAQLPRPERRLPRAQSRASPGCRALFFPLLTLLGGLSALIVLYAGGRLVMAGTVTVGEFVAFGVYLAMLVWPMIALGWAVNLVQRGAASMGRINQLFRERAGHHRARRRRPRCRRRAAGARSSSGTCGSPIPGARERGSVLQDISFRVEAGRSLAIVGATGSGKSTLVDLLVRAYDPDRGAVLIDGVDLRRLPLAELRRAIGFVPQETFLFSETLRENVLLGAPDDGRLERVAEVAQLTEALPALPDGLRHHAGRAGHQPVAAGRSSGAPSRARWRRTRRSSCSMMRSARWTRRPRRRSCARCAVPWRAGPASSSPTGSRRCATPTGSWCWTTAGSWSRAPMRELIARGGRYWELLRRQQLEEELEEDGER